MQSSSSVSGEPSFDASTPVVLFQVGSYPYLHGSLGAIRSLGRAGITTYAMLTDRYAPHGMSRFLRRRFLIDDRARDDAEALHARLLDVARELGRAAVLIPTDDEAAVLIAKNADQLRPHFLLPDISPELPETLASKRALFTECVRHGTPAPATIYTQSVAEALAAVADAVFPLVIKNSEPWTRLSRPVVGSTTIVNSLAEFRQLSRNWPANAQIIIQEYIPPDVAEDWIVHAYCGRSGLPLVAFTGRKYRSWPVQAGVTSAAMSLRNDELLATASAFCKAVGYRGIVDMDWRLDRRDGRYKLVDFNPRLGANFRLFVNTDGMDVVRALYLDLTGQPVPLSVPVLGRRFYVENLDWASLLWGSQRLPRGADSFLRSTALAWFSVDDPLPFIAMTVRFSGRIARRFILTAFGRLHKLSGMARRSSGPGRSIDKTAEP
ncbi:MAG: ATP-grasp domain-containing protein [Rhizobiales bacterium]|nr:ATP-grasp domain-containing protein [Hyphomicrobiales bacterium]MBI3674383.1 ATP-grasp domain-containing protein [Hyphomicrobiales bacterium]